MSVEIVYVSQFMDASGRTGDWLDEGLGPDLRSTYLNPSSHENTGDTRVHRPQEPRRTCSYTQNPSVLASWMRFSTFL